MGSQLDSHPFWVFTMTESLKLIQRRIIIGIDEWLSYALMVIAYNFMPRWFFYSVIIGYVYGVLYMGYYRLHKKYKEV